MAQITGTGPAQMRKLAILLRSADPQLKRELRRNFRALARPTVEKVQRSILDMAVKPSEPGARPHPPLRETIARTVGSSVGLTKNGIRLDIVSLGSKMPRGESTLPKHVDSREGWPHPVYARGSRFKAAPSKNRKFRHMAPGLRPTVKAGAWTWRHQTGKPQWFEDPIIASGRDLQDAAQAAMNDVAKRLKA
jgi:hypothetical protein